MTVKEPESSKKPRLLELFREAVRAQTYGGQDRLDKALEDAKNAGIEEDDIEWLEEIAADPQKFWDEFGPDALPEDLQAVLALVDSMAMPGWPKRFEGFYPKFNS